MNLEDFWNVIATMQEDADSLESHYVSCRNKLKELSNAELVDFYVQLTLHKYKAFDWDLWAAAFIINCGCSDDKFIDFRIGLIYQGKKTFELVLEDPECLVDVESAQRLLNYERFGYAPRYVFEEKNPDGPDIDDLADEKLYILDRPRFPHGEAWGDDIELKERFPRLTEKYPDYLDPNAFKSRPQVR
ncbi:MAG: DUF4240 domain-containing protein [Cyanobacteria bacterium TGS_CYA1]|nr:DUF4240 domain-containing protein [Cyanobacteria bacterium TGS_CYA1]